MGHLAATSGGPLARRVALVTGVSRRNGIGFATARLRTQLGAGQVINSTGGFQ